MINRIKSFFAREISFIFNKETRCILVYKHWWTMQTRVVIEYFYRGHETDYCKYDTTLLFQGEKVTRKKLKAYGKQQAGFYEAWTSKMDSFSKTKGC